MPLCSAQISSELRRLACWKQIRSLRYTRRRCVTWLDITHLYVWHVWYHCTAAGDKNVEEFSRSAHPSPAALTASPPASHTCRAMRGVQLHLAVCSALQGLASKSHHHDSSWRAQQEVRWLMHEPAAKEFRLDLLIHFQESRLDSLNRFQEFRLKSPIEFQELRLDSRLSALVPSGPRVSRYTTGKRVSEESWTLRDSYCMEKHFWYVYTERIRIEQSRVEQLKRFDLKKCDGELRRSCLSRQPACLQPRARLITFSTEEDLRGNTAKCRPVNTFDYT